MSCYVVVGVYCLKSILMSKLNKKIFYSVIVTKNQDGMKMSNMIQLKYKPSYRYIMVKFWNVLQFLPLFLTTKQFLGIPRTQHLCNIDQSYKKFKRNESHTLTSTFQFCTSCTVFNKCHQELLILGAMEEALLFCLCNI